ncbi:MerR family transcriptional regulator [Xylanimonas sp. McL0601]|uniref:MerR family transcriptional regulator n=1 Tax=Xylanimonas sp. McL0601 TaxID=3414739 RepID=UPI003CF51566
MSGTTVGVAMFSIGELATIGRVSVRMLRHYDEIGLLRPARVHPVTGYRAYAPEQAAALRRIVELKGLGLRLDDVARVVCDGVDDGEVRRLLTAARLEAAHRIADDTARLGRIDTELRRLEGEVAMSSTIDVQVRAVPAVHVATLTRPAPGFGPENIGPVVGPMFPEVGRLLEEAGVPIAGPPIADYTADEAGDGSGVLVTVAFRSRRRRRRCRASTSPSCRRSTTPR